MLSFRRLRLGPQLGNLRLQLPDRHTHAMPICARNGCTYTTSTQAGSLHLLPLSIAAQTWPPWRLRLARCSSIVIPAWAVQCDPQKGCKCAYGTHALWTGRVVRLVTVSGRPGNPSWVPEFHIQAEASCKRCARCNIHDMSSAAWDCRKQKRNSRFLDFRGEKTGEAPWPNSCYKPALVNAQVALLDARIDHTPSTASPWRFSLEDTDQLVSPELRNRLTPGSVKKLCQQGQVKGAVEVLEVLCRMNFGIDKYLVCSVLKECMVKKDLSLGSQIHELAVKMGFGSDTFLCNHFIRMYTAHGKLQRAMDVFRGVALPDAFTWSSIISAHVKQGQAERALELYQHMRATGMKPNGYVLVAALQACAVAGDLLSGKQVHDDVSSSGMEHDKFVGSCLVDMFAKCGSLKDARRVFDSLVEKNVVTWSAMIAAYARVEGMGQEALDLYSAMQNEGIIIPDAVTFVCLLQACANVGISALEKGKQLHLQVKEQRLEPNVVMGGSLVNMYVKCGSLKDARIVFDTLSEKNVVTWNAMMAGYARVEGMGQEALSLSTAMYNEGMVVPDAVTFLCLLQACANVGVPAIEQGKQLHSQVKERGLATNVVVGGSLVNMYVKCGNLSDARFVFDALTEKNVVTWAAMIAGYARQEGMGQEALNVYSAMRKIGTAVPDTVTYVCLLEACCSVGALQQGRHLHLEIREGGFEHNVLIATCLVKMYAKCGCLELAREVFDRVPVKDLVTWTALLKGYAEHGEGSMAIQCFEELLEQGVQPNEMIYTCLLTACGHAGLVDQGQQYFESMGRRHAVHPNNRHYCCMVDMFGRSGHLDRAEGILRSSGLADDAVSWRALLNACKSYGDAELGRRCFDHLVKLEPTDANAYVLLGGIYANAGRWDEVHWMECRRKAAGARKIPGKACIEVRKEVHEFTVGDDRFDVALTLRKMNTHVKEGGHVPQTQIVLRAVSEQEKEDALCGHAEKLALAYGLLHTPTGSTLVVTKNLRMCNDCHSSTKVMSRLEKRDIVVRDGHRVHRFQNGACSCQDRP